MSLFAIALRSIRQRGVASLLTMLSMALGVTLVVAVLSIHGVVWQSFRNNASLGYNMIIGPKGGREQLVLSSVYYISNAGEPVPYTYYLEFVKREERDRLLADSLTGQSREAVREAGELLVLAGGGMPGGVGEMVAATGAESRIPDLNRSDFPPIEFGRHGKYGQMIDLAIPLCLGDYYSRFRVVATTPALFDDLVWDIENNRKFEFAQGRNFQWRSPDHGYFEAVLGAHVAQQIRLSEIRLKLGADAAAAEALISARINWSRIHRDEGQLTVTLGQGTTEGDFFQTFKRLDKDVRSEKQKLDAAQAGALAALLDPAVVVSRRERRLALGDSIAPAHGDPEGHVHARKFAVVGILRASGTPHDKAVFINMEGFYLMEDHAKPLEEQPPEEEQSGKKLSREEQLAKYQQDQKRRSEIERAADPDPLPVEQREVSAVLLKIDPMFAPGIESGVNEGQYAMAVLPVAVIYRLFELIVNPIQATLLLLTAIICIVSGVSILVSIYNSMSERRGEIAVMRALGAGRETVMTIILMEAALLALGGGLLGWLVGHLACLAASPWIEQQTGVHVGFLSSTTLPVEMALIPALVLLAILVGLWPALSAYRTDVARSLGK